jgi:hypothetical protein
MEDNKVLKLVYTFFLGLLLAIFVGVGINTFYESPQYPEYPNDFTAFRDDGPTKEQSAQEAEFDKQLRQHDESAKPYNRNVSIITLVSAVALMAISLAFEKRIKQIADGIMLGGLFTLLYSLGRGFASEDSKYIFVAVTVSLAAVLYLGYHRFVRPDGKGSKPKKPSKKS